jgi:hypothetical protein
MYLPPSFFLFFPPPPLFKRFILTGAALAVKQVAVKVIAFQWIFAFVIFAVFLVGSLYVSSAAYSGRNLWLKRVVAPESTADREREPLLNDA